MKVWVVARWYSYEGYSEPVGVFDSEEKAKTFAAEQEKEYRWADGVEVFEMTVE